jgi:hypothetical protein
MDAIVKTALEKWPNVPHAYGWLSLDEHGNWALKDSPIANATLIDFIGRNYSCDERGRWFFQNGPQRVYVTLAATPFVLKVALTQPQLSFLTHTGEQVEAIERILCDANDRMLVVASIRSIRHVCLIAPREVAQLSMRLESASDSRLALRISDREALTVEPIDLPSLRPNATLHAFEANPRPADGETEC